MARKSCKGCKKSFPTSSFPNSATAKDGKLGYCSGCWSKRMSAARKNREKKVAAGEVPPMKKPGPRKKSGKGHLDVLNGALEAANGTKDIWVVVAEDGDTKEYKGKTAKRRAIKQALLWKLEGYDCTLREIHEYKPSLSLDLIG